MSLGEDDFDGCRLVGSDVVFVLDRFGDLCGALCVSLWSAEALWSTETLCGYCWSW